MRSRPLSAEPALRVRHPGSRIPAGSRSSSVGTSLQRSARGQLHCRLHDAVVDRWDAQRSGPAIAFRDLDPPDRLRLVAAIPQCRRKLGEIQFRMRFEPLDALAIHTRGAFVAQDFLPGRFQRVGCKHLTHQTVPTTSFDAVDQRRHDAVGPDRIFDPRRVAGFWTSRSPRGARAGAFCDPFGSDCASTFRPTFPRRGFALRTFRGSIAAAARCGLRTSGRRLDNAAGLYGPSDRPSGHAIPNHVVRPNVTFLPPRASGRLLQNQASPKPRGGSPRHAAEFGFVFRTACPSASSCSPRRLGTTRRFHPRTTQLLSATCAVTSHGTD